MVMPGRSETLPTTGTSTSSTASMVATWRAPMTTSCRVLRDRTCAPVPSTQVRVETDSAATETVTGAPGAVADDSCATPSVELSRASAWALPAGAGDPAEPLGRSGYDACASSGYSGGVKG